MQPIRSSGKFIGQIPPILQEGVDEYHFLHRENFHPLPQKSHEVRPFGHTQNSITYYIHIIYLSYTKYHQRKESTMESL